MSMTNLKAISLWEPWASAMGLERKRNETRSFATNHLGDLAICSAKRPTTPVEARLAQDWLGHSYRPIYGCVLCVVELYACVPTDYFYRGPDPLQISPCEAALGNYLSGRFAWLTRNCRPLNRPVPVVGRQGLWFLPANVLKQVNAQLGPV